MHTYYLIVVSKGLFHRGFNTSPTAKEYYYKGYFDEKDQ